MATPPLDILILSNGPGEVMTWVCPVVQELRRQLDRASTRISVILSPCPNATGIEAEVAASFEGVDRTQAAQHFYPFLLWGKTQEAWDWHPQGVVLFLGGDQLFPVIIGKRLGYRTVIYAEWEARWPRWVDGFGVMNAQVQQKLPAQYQPKCRVVGDLMTDIQAITERISLDTETIGILPGSKPMKLTQGLPYAIAMADYLHKVRPQAQVALFVAPTLTLETLAQYADPSYNPVAQRITDATITLHQPQGETPFLLTSNGAKLWLWTDYPNHDNLLKCTLCFTTAGANTAELGALCVPMILFFPMLQLDAMRAWDGLPGLIANLPGVGTVFAQGFNWVMLQLYQRNHPLYAWPNIWAGGKEVVPELLGHYTPQDFVDFALTYLDNPAKLEQMRMDLRQLRGEAGAAARLVQLVADCVG